MMTYKVCAICGLMRTSGAPARPKAPTRVRVEPAPRLPQALCSYEDLEVA